MVKVSTFDSSILGSFLVCCYSVCVCVRVRARAHTFPTSLIYYSYPGLVVTSIYILLLAVKLPELLAYVNIEEETLSSLQQKLHDFLK